MSSKTCAGGCSSGATFRRFEETFQVRTFGRQPAPQGRQGAPAWRLGVATLGENAPKPQPKPSDETNKTKKQQCLSCWNNFVKTNLGPGIQQLVLEHQNCLASATANRGDTDCVKEAKVNDCIGIFNGKLNGLRNDCKVWSTLCNEQYGPCGLNGRCPTGMLPPRLPLQPTPSCDDE
jgi:hypothetical protein